MTFCPENVGQDSETMKSGIFCSIPTPFPMLGIIPAGGEGVGRSSRGPRGNSQINIQICTHDETLYLIEVQRTEGGIFSRAVCCVGALSATREAPSPALLPTPPLPTIDPSIIQSPGPPLIPFVLTVSFLPLFQRAPGATAWSGKGAGRGGSMSAPLSGRWASASTGRKRIGRPGGWVAEGGERLAGWLGNYLWVLSVASFSVQEKEGCVFVTWKVGHTGDRGDILCVHTRRIFLFRSYFVYRR